MMYSDLIYNKKVASKIFEILRPNFKLNTSTFIYCTLYYLI